jgi:threonine dehydratase
MIPTPLIRLGNLFADRRVFAKCEFVTPAGSFKSRGARHLLTHLSRQSGTRQLVVPSMGNTALAVAMGAREFGFKMLGVVPQSISRAKDEKLQALGADLHRIVGGGNELLLHARQVASERGAYFVHPHLDARWTDGYQAIADEILTELPNCRSLVFPVGGGGLLMGMTEYLLRRTAILKLFGCEPYNYPTYARFEHERSATIADGLLLETPHAKVQERIESMSITMGLVTDSQIRAALCDLFRTHALIVEPSSAITTAFVQSRLNELEDPICVVLTGENVARDDFYRLIMRAPP